MLTHREKIDKVLDLYPEMSHTMVIPESSCDAMLEQAQCAQDMAQDWFESLPAAEDRAAQHGMVEAGKALKHPEYWIKGYLQQAIKSNEPAAVKAFAAKALADWFLAHPEMKK